MQNIKYYWEYNNLYNTKVLKSIKIINNNNNNNNNFKIIKEDKPIIYVSIFKVNTKSDDKFLFPESQKIKFDQYSIQLFNINPNFYIKSVSIFFNKTIIDTNLINKIDPKYLRIQNVITSANSNFYVNYDYKQLKLTFQAVKSNLDDNYRDPDTNSLITANNLSSIFQQIGGFNLPTIDDQNFSDSDRFNSIFDSIYKIDVYYYNKLNRTFSNLIQKSSIKFTFCKKNDDQQIRSNDNIWSTILQDNMWAVKSLVYSDELNYYRTFSAPCNNESSSSNAEKNSCNNCTTFNPLSVCDASNKVPYAICPYSNNSNSNYYPNIYTAENNPNPNLKLLSKLKDLSNNILKKDNNSWWKIQEIDPMLLRKTIPIKKGDPFQLLQSYCPSFIIGGVYTGWNTGLKEENLNRYLEIDSEAIAPNEWKHQPLFSQGQLPDPGYNFDKVIYPSFGPDNCRQPYRLADYLRSYNKKDSYYQKAEVFDFTYSLVRALCSTMAVESCQASDGLRDGLYCGDNKTYSNNSKCLKITRDKITFNDSSGNTFIYPNSIFDSDYNTGTTPYFLQYTVSVFYPFINTAGGNGAGIIMPLISALHSLLLVNLNIKKIKDDSFKNSLLLLNIVNECKKIENIDEKNDKIKLSPTNPLVCTGFSIDQTDLAKDFLPYGIFTYSSGLLPPITSEGIIGNPFFKTYNLNTPKFDDGSTTPNYNLWDPYMNTRFGITSGGVFPILDAVSSGGQQFGLGFASLACFLQFILGDNFNIMRDYDLKSKNKTDYYSYDSIKSSIKPFDKELAKYMIDVYYLLAYTGKSFGQFFRPNLILTFDSKILRFFPPGVPNRLTNNEYYSFYPGLNKIDSNEPYDGYSGKNINFGSLFNYDLKYAAYLMNVRIQDINISKDNIDDFNKTPTYFSIYTIPDSGWNGSMTAEVFSYQMINAAWTGNYEVFCALHRFYFYCLWMQNGGIMDQDFNYLNDEDEIDTTNISKYTYYNDFFKPNSIQACNLSSDPNVNIEYNKKYKDLSGNLVDTSYWGWIPEYLKHPPNSVASDWPKNVSTFNDIHPFSNLTEYISLATKSDDSKQISKNVILSNDGGISSVTFNNDELENLNLFNNPNQYTLILSSSQLIILSDGNLNRSADITLTLTKDKNTGSITSSSTITVAGSDYIQPTIIYINPFNENEKLYAEYNYPANRPSKKFDRTGAINNRWSYPSFLMGFNPSFTYLGVRKTDNFFKGEQLQTITQNIFENYEKFSASNMYNAGGPYGFFTDVVKNRPKIPLVEVKNPYYSSRAGNELYSASDADQNIWRAYKIAEYAAERGKEDKFYGNFLGYDNNKFFTNDDDDNINLNWNENYNLNKYSPFATGFINVKDPTKSAFLDNNLDKNNIQRITWKYMRQQLGNAIKSLKGYLSGQKNASPEAGLFCIDGVLYDKRCITEGHGNDQNSVKNFHADYCDFRLMEWNLNNNEK